MQCDIRMSAASGELRWCLANGRKGCNSGLEPNSSFTRLQTESPLGFSPAILRKLFFPICNEAQISVSTHALCRQYLFSEKIS